MLSITTLIIAAVFFIILLLVSIFVPNPITWLMTLALGAVFYFILWPKYQGQQQAVRQGRKCAIGTKNAATPLSTAMKSSPWRLILKTAKCSNS